MMPGLLWCKRLSIWLSGAYRLTWSGLYIFAPLPLLCAPTFTLLYSCLLLRLRCMIDYIHECCNKLYWVLSLVLQVNANIHVCVLSCSSGAGYGRSDWAERLLRSIISSAFTERRRGCCVDVATSPQWRSVTSNQTISRKLSFFLAVVLHHIELFCWYSLHFWNFVYLMLSIQNTVGEDEPWLWPCGCRWAIMSQVSILQCANRDSCSCIFCCSIWKSPEWLWPIGDWNKIE